VNEINIIGKKFGNLLVLEDTKKYTKNNTRKYKIFKCKESKSVMHLMVYHLLKYKVRDFAKVEFYD
jgi:hypothetical protein